MKQFYLILLNSIFYVGLRVYAYNVDDKNTSVVDTNISLPISVNNG